MTIYPVVATRCFSDNERSSLLGNHLYRLNKLYEQLWEVSHGRMHYSILLITFR